MSTVSQLRNTIADFFEVPEQQIGPSFSLRGRSESIARAALDAAIRHRVGRVARSVYSAQTYGEIEAELFPNKEKDASASPVGAAVFQPEASHSAPNTTGSALSCGIDIERVENMPIVGDYWESPFYCGNFAPAEIAFCLRQEFPAMHFAARWCAKEALKKCDQSFLAEEMNRIELVSNNSGAAYVVHHVDRMAMRLPHTVSLSHTSDVAVAVVVKSEVCSQPPGVVLAAQSELPIPVAPNLNGTCRIWWLSFVSFLLSLLAVSCAVVAFLRSL